jgi:hypothetical protein
MCDLCIKHFRKSVDVRSVTIANVKLHVPDILNNEIKSVVCGLITVFIFARNIISESLLAVGQILTAVRKAFGFGVVSNCCKNGKKKRSSILDTQRKCRAQHYEKSTCTV